jgi:hypothetical protein
MKTVNWCDKHRINFGCDVQCPKCSAEIENLLRRMLEWDHLSGSSDGPYWKHEIGHILEEYFE